MFHFVTYNCTTTKQFPLGVYILCTFHAIGARIKGANAIGAKIKVAIDGRANVIGAKIKGARYNRARSNRSSNILTHYFK